jgi:hypothetical protein
MQCTVKSKTQLEPRPILAASTDELTQNTLVISEQHTFKHIRQSPEFLFNNFNGSVPDLETGTQCRIERFLTLENIITKLTFIARLCTVY